VSAIAFHLGLYKDPDPAWFALQALRQHGWHVQRRAGSVFLFQRGPGTSPVVPEPDRTQPVFCQGWYGDTGNGRYMSETHAPFWVHGKPKLTFGGRRPRVAFHKGPKGWTLVTVDVPHLVRLAGQKQRVGARLTSP
jgi:hypothetical protein